jgi:MATE family multidrug resistance protein
MAPRARGDLAALTGHAGDAAEPRGLAELLRLSLPMIVSVVSYNAMTLADTLFVGRIGVSPLAGVALGGTAGLLMMFFAAGVLSAGKTLVAQSTGARRADEVAAYAGAAVASALGLGVAMLAVAQPLAELLPHVSATAAAGDAARSYLRIRSLGAPLALLAVALREVRYGQGNAVAPALAAVVANLANIALAYTLVLAWHRGVAGAAVATLIAQALEVALLAAIARPALSLRAVRRRHVGTLWQIGLPAGSQFLVEVGAMAVLTSLISAMSAREVAAHQIALQIMQLAILPAFAIGEAGAVLAARAVGADRDRAVVRVARSTLAVVAAYTVPCSAVFALAGDYIASQFTPDAALAQVASRLVLLAALIQIINGANIVARATLRGCGDVRFSAWVGALTAWVLTPPIAWALGYHAGLGALGGWLGIGCEAVIATAILWWRLLHGQWRYAAAQSRARMGAEPAAPGGDDQGPSPATTPVLAPSASKR